MTQITHPVPPDRPGPLMASAHAAAAADTREIPAVVEPVVEVVTWAPTDPLDELVDRLRPRLARAVDALQVTAALEADGFTDRTARLQFGFPDVFGLADAVHLRFGPIVEPDAVSSGAPRAAGTPYQAPRSQALREAFHGFLYALPAAVFPAALAVLGSRSLVMGMVLAGALGWIVAGASSWWAYQLLGGGQVDAAARLMRWSTAAGLGAAGVLGGLLSVLTGARPTLVALAVGQMAYQMASTLLMFARRELILLGTMSPAAACGVGYLLVGEPLLVWSLLAAVVGVVTSLGFGLWAVGHPSERLVQTLGVFVSQAEGAQTVSVQGGAAGPRRIGDTVLPRQRPLRALLGTHVFMVPWVTAYTALTAMYLLHAQAPYLLARRDIVLAAVPLIAGTGVVEWRARRFSEQAGLLPLRVRRTRQYVRRAWGYLFVGLVWSMGVVAVLSAGMLAVLHRWGLDTTEAVVMSGAYVFLAGAYYLGFLLAERARFGWLCGSLLVATAVHVVVARLLPGSGGSVGDTLSYLGSAGLLQVLFGMALVPVVGRVWRYR